MSAKLIQEDAEKHVLKRCKEMNYELVEPFIYDNRNSKMKLRCPIHNYTWIVSYKRLNITKCKKCLFPIKNNNVFISELKNIFGNKYDLSNVEYKGWNIAIKLTCPIHGDFYKKPRHILETKSGCQECSKETADNNQKSNIKVLINRFNDIHNNYYNYSNIVYKNTYTKIKIICPIHGEFEQAPREHLHGKGCPKCNLSKGELYIGKLLKNNNILYESQKSFKDCKDKYSLKFDFYLPELNTLIEYDGKQHFEIIEHWGDIEGLKDRQKKDKIKNDFCKSNDIKLIRIRYDENIEEKLKENGFII